MYNFPKAAAFGKMVAKSKIYEHTNPSTKIRELFIKEVEKITWAYKLSPATINLPASDDVLEIQVFAIHLKNSTWSLEILQTIDKAIPSPIIFMLCYNGRSCYVAAYKRPSESDKSRWVISSYFQSEWLNDSTEKTDLPIVLNMASLYHSFIKKLCPLNTIEGETLAGLVSRVDRLRVKERDAEKIESRIKKEKQFNRRVELNRSLNELKQEIENLKR